MALPASPPPAAAPRRPAPWDTVLAALALLTLIVGVTRTRPVWPDPPDTPAHRLAHAQAEVARLRPDYVYPRLARVGADSAVAVVRDGEQLQRWFALAQLAHPAPDLVALLLPAVSAGVSDEDAVRLLQGGAGRRRARLEHLNRLLAQGRPVPSALETVFAQRP